jgi:hypothetical protein
MPMVSREVRFPEPCALHPGPHSYVAVTKDEDNAAHGRFPTAS